MTKEVVKKYGNRVKYSEKELETFHEGGHRIRHIERISEVAPLYSIEAEVIKSHNCNSGLISEILNSHFISDWPLDLQPSSFP